MSYPVTLVSNFLVAFVSGFLELPLFQVAQAKSFQSMFHILVVALSDPPPDVFLDDDDCPSLHAELTTDQIAAATGLQADNVAAQVLEAMRQDSRADESLQPQESATHFQVALALGLTSPLALNDYSGAPEANVATSMNPSADATLDDDQFLG
jgi:hypothetical protein